MPKRDYGVFLQRRRWSVAVRNKGGEDEKKEEEQGNK